MPDPTVKPEPKLGHVVVWQCKAREARAGRYCTEDNRRHSGDGCGYHQQPKSYR